MQPNLRFALAVTAALCPALSFAHAFTQPYTLPVPFSLYALGAGAALIVSFLIVGLFATAPSLGQVATHQARAKVRPAHGSVLLGVARALSLFLLLVTILTGLFGTQRAMANFNMTFFWIVFVLGVPYAVALLGDFYAAVNPWNVLVEWLERAGLDFGGRSASPERWGYAPALLLYMAFIWIELFARLQPRGLSFVLLAYTLVNVAGAWWFGKKAWFRYGEFFGVFLRLIGRMSPWARPWDPQEARAYGDGPRWRAPFVGLLEERVTHVSLVLFILFMLSSTAFDGLHATLPFASIFWKGIYPTLAPLVPFAPGQQYAMSAQLYYIWQWCALFVSPLLYLAVFVGFVWVAQRITGAAESVGALVLRFTAALVPIAFVYHVTHYYTLLLAQGGQIVRLASDPFGWGWDLFGTAKLPVEPFVVEVDTIWHTQVALILAGHIISVYLAHVEALRCFPDARRAALSQLPLLVLMVMFTTLGLWILSLPLATGG
jgi:hypothetical protein